MKALISSVPIHRPAKALLFVFAASTVCAFFSACAGPAYRHERRVDRRGERWDRREDRYEDRWGRRYDRRDRRYERWD